MMILRFLALLIDLIHLIHLHHLQTCHYLPVLLCLLALPALPHRVWSMWTILSLLLCPQGLHPTLAAQNRLTALPSASRLLSLRQNRLLTLLRFPNSLLVSNDQNCLLGWICTLLSIKERSQTQRRLPDLLFLLLKSLLLLCVLQQSQLVSEHPELSEEKQIVVSWNRLCIPAQGM